MTKLTDRTFGSLTVHADGSYTWKGRRLTRACAMVLDAAFLTPCNVQSAASYAFEWCNRLRGATLKEASAWFLYDGGIGRLSAEYVRANWVWVNE